MRSWLSNVRWMNWMLKEVFQVEQRGGTVFRSMQLSRKLSFSFRYQNNNKRIRHIMREFGFKELIKPEYQTYIITSFYYPPAPFHFDTFYSKLSERGLWCCAVRLSRDVFRL